MATNRRWTASVGRYLITAFGAITLVFLIPRLVPGDPLAGLVDEQSPLTAESRAQILDHYGLDRPLVSQYGHYLNNIARGDLGRSITSNISVARLIRFYLPWTLLLCGTALVLSVALSWVAGIGAGWSRGTFGDRLTVVSMTALNAIPEFAWAMVLLIAFAVIVPIFPAAGGKTPFNEGASLVSRVGDIAWHLVLPALALGVSLTGAKFLMLRNTMIGVLGQDYMVLARAKGLPEARQKYRHAGRNALLPFVTLVGLQAGVAVGGALFIEAVFGYPGIATLLLPAVNNLDYPLLDGIFLCLAMVVLTANLVVDLVSARLDHRVAR